MQVQESTSAGSAERLAAWGAVFAMTLCVFVLIASEFMPVSLLTPIAGDLHMTEGQAGQAIAVSGILAMLTSLFIASVSRRIDRKTLLACLTAVMLASGLIVALAPSYAIFMLGRALLGVAIGGFSSMSTATVMRLVPENVVPKALAILNSGNALAAIIAAPLGGFLGSYVGWRGAFIAVVPLAAIALGWQLLSLPSMPSSRATRSTNALRLLAKPDVGFGIGAILLLFMGQFALFTYVRPFLESVTRVDAATLSLLLLVIGVIGLIGTMLVGALLKRGLYVVVVTIPFAMAAIAMALMAFGGWLPGGAATWRVGSDWYTRAGRLRHMAVTDAPGGCRGGRRAHGRDHSVWHHARRDCRRFSLRRERLSGDVYFECGLVGRRGTACDGRGTHSPVSSKGRYDGVTRRGALSLHQRGSRQGAAALLDDGVREMLAQIPMHDSGRSGASRDGSTSICSLGAAAPDANPIAMRQRRETVEHRSARSRPGWARHTS